MSISSWRILSSVLFFSSGLEFSPFNCSSTYSGIPSHKSGLFLLRSSEGIFLPAQYSKSSLKRSGDFHTIFMPSLSSSEQVTCTAHALVRMPPPPLPLGHTSLPSAIALMVVDFPHEKSAPSARENMLPLQSVFFLRAVLVISSACSA